MGRTSPPDSPASITSPAGPGPTLRAPSARGQGVVEYGLILSLSTLLAVVLLAVFGSTLSLVLQTISNAIDAAT